MTETELCRHAPVLAAMTHDTYLHRIYGTCEACEMGDALRCSCGYDACCGVDFEEHADAMGRAVPDERHEAR